MAKITAIGAKTWSDKASKTYRSISIDGKEMSAWDRTADAVDRFKVGDDVEIQVAEKNGRLYLNKITSAGAGNARPGGNSQQSGTSGWKPDPEKDLGVYTRYCLDAVLTGKYDEKSAVELVFGLRKVVKARLLGEKEASDDTLEIKTKAVIELLAKAGIKTVGEGTPWPSYITKRLRQKDGFKGLTEDLQGLIEHHKELSALADGTPVFINVEE